MRTVFWVSLLLAIGASPLAKSETSAVTSDRGAAGHAASDYKIKLDIRSEAGVSYRVRVSRDGTVSRSAKPTKIEAIGEIAGVAVIFVDTYPSIPGGMSYCQAGEERFLHIVSIKKMPPIETFHEKIESCRDNFELASPGVEWLPESSTIRINKFPSPGATAASDSQTIRIGSDGKPESQH
jgi:hypothetical protein